ncbi:MAG: transposase family protein [Clostridiales bacterium]|nr:transposase family protein [Clostridiales bacterium]
MQKNELLQGEDTIIRVLGISEGNILIVDCLKRSVPRWLQESALACYEECNEATLSKQTGIVPLSIENLDAKSRSYAYKRFSMIAGILPFIGIEKERCMAVNKMAEYFKVSNQTIKYLLWLYLVYQNVSVLAPKQCIHERELTADEKNMRWALNKFFYTQHKNSLQTAYTYMLKERYCDSTGVLLQEYPTIHQFRYFYRKNRKKQTYFIARSGVKDYEKNHRPLLGDGIQEFAPHIGIAMLDATVCDIYLVNEAGSLVGRPILVLAVDGYSSMVCGYSLLWEGGVYSLRGLMLNIIADKVEHCKRFGIRINKSDWNCDKLPAVLVTDMGNEYVSATFEQLSELGVTLVNLPAYRPDLKGNVEKAFDLIQGYFKPYLMGKGLIEPDFRERGSHDYRKDACLTLKQFEAILLRCIVYYNTSRTIENFPYTENMVQEGIKPLASAIWNYGLAQDSADLISVTSHEIILTLLPRTEGRFSRNGLKVNGMRYKDEGFTEKYLSGGTATVAYNPDDVSYVWLIDNGTYTRFELIESRFKGMDLTEVETLRGKQKSLVKATERANMQAKIDLASHIDAIVSTAATGGDVDIKGVRKSRQRERSKNHVDYVQKGGVKNA